MGIFALLLVSAVLHLCNLAACAPRGHHQINLKDIISEIDKYNYTRNHFVDDVQDLVDAGCKDDFFCTVLCILKNNTNPKHKKNEQEQKILRNLAVFTNMQKMECEKNTKTTGNGVKKPISALLGFLQDCSRRRISFWKTRA